MKRNHIHCAKGVPEDATVISGEQLKIFYIFTNNNITSSGFPICQILLSFVCLQILLFLLYLCLGMRKSCEVLIYVDLQKALTGAVCMYAICYKKN